MNVDMQSMINAARAGGVVVNQYFGQALQTEQKSSASDLRTKADTESEQAILDILTKKFPNFNIYAEETGAINRQSEYTLVIDPLDGTSNFVLGIPDFAISIGLVKGVEAVAGVIYNPTLDQLYMAEIGKGAFLNNQRIHVNQELEMTRTTVAYTCGYNTSREYTESTISKLRDKKVKELLTIRHQHTTIVYLPLDE